MKINDNHRAYTKDKELELRKSFDDKNGKRNWWVLQERKLWTDDDKAYLIKNYSHIDEDKLRDKLHMSKDCIQWMVKKLKLKRESKP